MKHITRLAAHILLGCTAFAGSQPGQAAQIVVGQVAPLSGPEASQGRAYAAGMQLFFNSVNKSGGVSGNTFVLVTKDDGGRPTDTAKLTRQLLAENQPLVLAGYFGSRNVTEVLTAGLLEKERIALVGYRAADIRDETPLLYNVRANLQDELGKITEHLATLGVTRLGLLHEDGPVAARIIAATEQLATKGKAAIVAKAAYEAGTTRVSSAIDTFIKAQPQAIIVVSSGQAGARFIEQYRSEGGAAQIFVHSGADMERVAKRISEDRMAFVTTVMRGVAIAQVVPSPYQVSGIAKELNGAASKFGKPDVPVSYVLMEGYIAAKVIVEAVRRQGTRPTREGTAAALDAITNLDLGGYVVGFKPGARNGARFVELTIISGDGTIRR
jgi:branched-chain amino acid transport system substrate-binding protein